MKDMVLIPRVSEKAYAMSQQEGVKVYVIEVPKDAEKLTVKRAVEAQFDVSVTQVRTVTHKGKQKMSYRKRVRPVNGRRSDIKKAYVTLKAGDELPFFVEEAKAQAEEESRAVKASKRGKK
jgi:large subunit ribosomal protein L23